MNRRGFLGLLGAAAGALVLPVEPRRVYSFGDGRDLWGARVVRWPPGWNPNPCALYGKMGRVEMLIVDGREYQVQELNWCVTKDEKRIGARIRAYPRLGEIEFSTTFEVPVIDDPARSSTPESRAAATEWWTKKRVTREAAPVHTVQMSNGERDSLFTALERLTRG